jgi:hypothetical protein
VLEHLLPLCLLLRLLVLLKVSLHLLLYLECVLSLSGHGLRVVSWSG